MEFRCCWMAAAAKVGGWECWTGCLRGCWMVGLEPSCQEEGRQTKEVEGRVGSTTGGKEGELERVQEPLKGRQVGRRLVFVR